MFNPAANQVCDPPAFPQYQQAAAQPNPGYQPPVNPFQDPAQQWSLPGYQQPARPNQGYQPPPAQPNQGYQPPPAQSGYHPAAQPNHYQPPPAQSGYQPPPAQSGYQPPPAQSGYQPPAQPNHYQPPPAQSGYHPAAQSNQGYQPPPANQYQYPPQSQYEHQFPPTGEGTPTFEHPPYQPPTEANLAFQPPAKVDLLEKLSSVEAAYPQTKPSTSTIQEDRLASIESRLEVIQSSLAELREEFREVLTESNRNRLQIDNVESCCKNEIAELRSLVKNLSDQISRPDSTKMIDRWNKPVNNPNQRSFTCSPPTLAVKKRKSGNYDAALPLWTSLMGDRSQPSLKDHSPAISAPSPIRTSLKEQSHPESFCRISQEGSDKSGEGSKTVEDAGLPVEGSSSTAALEVTTEEQSGHSLPNPLSEPLEVVVPIEGSSD